MKGQNMAGAKTGTVYNRLSDYLKNKYSAPVKKICIDGGFTCPNRDGAKGVSGCIFCGGEGSGEQILNRNFSVEEQINRAIAENNNTQKFIAYFQNFTNTYAKLDVLKERFLPALKNEKIVGLSIATRPDCVDEEKAKYFGGISKIKDISVELGLQTSNDKTAKIINRCYESKEFTSAVAFLNKHNIDIVVHIILGLPQESAEDVRATVEFLNRHKYSGIKIHSLYVTEGTALANMYLKNNYTPLSKEEYVKRAAYVLSNISPEIIVHRLTGDGNKKQLLAPDWTKDKITVINAIYKEMTGNGLTQGCFYKG